MLRVSGVTVLLLAACAAPETVERTGMEQAIYDYIEIHKLTELDSLRSSSHDHWSELDEKFVIYNGRREAYLVEFTRACSELTEHPVVPDVRSDRNAVRARLDTIRGCPIHKIFALSENDVAELTTLGRPVDSGN